MNHGHRAPLLELRHVSVTEGLSGRPLVRDVSFSLQRGHCLGIVGESGSGKSLLCRALLNLLPSGLVRSGQVLFDGRDLSRLDPAGWRELRGTVTLRSQAEIEALFCMTPYYYKTGARDQAKLRALDTLTTETEFALLIYKKA